MSRPSDPRKEQFWRRLLRLWQQSPSTVRDFCAQHRVSEPSFYAWRRTLARRQQQRTPSAGQRPTRPPDAAQADHSAAFVPLGVLPATAAAVLEVVLGPDCLIRIPPDFDAATLRRLLAVLKEQPPC